MALVSCPECGKEISDTARSCPHCGYSATEKPANQTRRTPLIDGPSRAPGILFAAGGMVMILFGLLILPLGFFPIIIGVAMMIFGMQRLSGTQTGRCPYCGNEVMIPINDRTCKCSHCHKISTKTGNFLETID